ncbi:hypothetical protein F5Y18DRAFT_429186 [Xylariaceae sp. FL1019]|nr:hypothetical protein F5Y18DRAFT_429186 [Xylariaceae sp. FL1019]
MSFGYSVGDFMTGASLTCQLIRALSSSRGACHEYQDAIVELRAMEQVFIQAGNLVQTNMFAQDDRLGDKSGCIESSWAKVGWQLFRKDELHALKTQLHERLTSINTLIAIARCTLDTPSSLAQYEDKSDEFVKDTERKSVLESASTVTEPNNSPSPTSSPVTDIKQLDTSTLKSTPSLGIPSLTSTDLAPREEIQSLNASTTH